MQISRRWFLKSAVMAAVATQLPLLPEGHRVLFVDDGGLLVTDYIQNEGVIKAKVVNGLWDLVIDTKAKMVYSYSNPAYGYDAPEIGAALQNSWSYQNLTEVSVPKHIGVVPDELKPYKKSIRKFVDLGEPGSEWTTEARVFDVDGNPMTQRVPARRQVTTTYTGGGQYGSLTFTHWAPVMEEITIDPLNGAGVDYNAVVEAAEKKAGIKRPTYTYTEEDEEAMKPISLLFIEDLRRALEAV